MSKFATPFTRSAKPLGWLCAALIALLLAPAQAAAIDPALRRSESMDIGRLGKVSEDERSVLRIEWRSARTGADESQMVQTMLDSLQRLEVTVGKISRLILQLPAENSESASGPKLAPASTVVPAATSSADAAPAKATAPVVAAVQEQTEEPDNGDSRLLFANIAAACLVALWWVRRRKARSSVSTVEDANNTSGVEASEIERPTAARSRPAEPEIEHATPPSVVKSTPAAVAIETPVTLSAQTPAKAEHRAVAPDGFPPAVTVPLQTSASPPPAEPNVIDFSLEEADAETIARQNAKRPAPSSAPPTVAAEPPTPRDLEPTLQLAEIMLSMGLDQGAAQALLEYIDANPRQAVYHWLKLLGIYRRKGLQQEFADTAAKLRQHFNVQAGEWMPASTGEAPTLEQFARVADQVKQLWSKPDECTRYLRHLLEDNRDGARAGFPQSVAEEILFLIEVIKENDA